MKKNFGYSINADRQIDYDALPRDVYLKIEHLEPSIKACISCGTCSATCSAAQFTDFSLRRYILLIRRGDTNEVKKKISQCVRQMSASMPHGGKHPQPDLYDSKHYKPKLKHNMFQFDWFVLPFSAGLAFLLSVLAVKYSSWIWHLPKNDRYKVKRGIFSAKSFRAVHEVFMESLLHRKIFRVNTLLGFMHMSLAFGWFLLIVVGNFESRLFHNGHISPPYVPIFFRFFNPNPQSFEYERIFSFVMDSLLVLVLTGVALAWIKRMYSRMFGMKKTTQLRITDKLALTSLWVIFPLRFLAESLSSAAFGGGSFLTANSGYFLGSFLPANALVYPAWWAYSLSLGLFFAVLPWSRYMHIPTEVVLIFLRKYGVTEKQIHTTYTQVEANACSRCGICIDTCQLAADAGIKNTQSVYYLQNVRWNNSDDQQKMKCLMCGRCDNICPVGIDIKQIRMAGRKTKVNITGLSYPYLPNPIQQMTEVLYFAGCMTHLQPSIKKAMTGILKKSGVNFRFMDEHGSICCGRPLLLAGKNSQANELIEKNRQIIYASGAKLLVTSCPICYKVFNEEYQLDIPVLHHSQYLLSLVKDGKINPKHQPMEAVYHDPCELGRGSGIYEQPRELLSRIMKLQNSKYEKENALCCGGSLANLTLQNEDRKKITIGALEKLTIGNPESIVTSCPLCKKTFANTSPIAVYDIAEVVYNSISSIKSNESERIPELIEENVSEELLID